MNSLKKQINRALELFYVSIDDDIDTWHGKNERSQKAGVLARKSLL